LDVPARRAAKDQFEAPLVLPLHAGWYYERVPNGWSEFRGLTF
jgi:hypothetical protein